MCHKTTLPLTQIHADRDASSSVRTDALDSPPCIASNTQAVAVGSQARNTASRRDGAAIVVPLVRQVKLAVPVISNGQACEIDAATPCHDDVIAQNDVITRGFQIYPSRSGWG